MASSHLAASTVLLALVGSLGADAAPVARYPGSILYGAANLVLTFKSGFSDEHLKVRSTVQQGGFAVAVGATYNQFAIPKNVSIEGGGKGEVTYVGFMPGDALIEKLMADAVDRAGVSHPGADLRYPLIVRNGVSGKGRALHYLLNYSATNRTVPYPYGAGIDLLSGKPVAGGGKVHLDPWGVAIVAENAAAQR